MRNMYQSDRRWDVQYVPIEDVLMTKPLSAAIKENGGSIKGKGFRKDPKFPGFGMSRMGNMMEQFRSNASLPPIQVKRVGDFYSIQDGRHRFACSVVFGYEKVPIIVMDNVCF